MALVEYAEDNVFEAVQANLRSTGSDEKFRIFQRMFRKTARLMMWASLMPRRILLRKSCWDPPPMDARIRELFYKVLGDYSRRVMSLVMWDF